MMVHGEWLLTPRRMAVHVPTATAVVADVHLGYDRARQRRGEAVPLTGLDDFRDALRGLLRSHSLRRLVVAGDLLEDTAGLTLISELLQWLHEHQLELAVVPGNHDRSLVRGAPSVPLHREGLRIGDWLVIHGDARAPSGCVVMGHFHPCLRCSEHITAPCYLVARERLVLPAFSPDAAGVNVVGARRWRGHQCIAIAGDQLLDFGDVGRLAAHRVATSSEAASHHRRSRQSLPIDKV
jgi:putative SbcD/Mre11-related phosphoesterase